MRILTLSALALLTACSSIDPSSLRARDFAWLTGTWRGVAPERGALELVFDEPRDGAMQGEYVATQDGQMIAQSSMRLVSGTGGVTLLGTIEGNPARNFRLVEVSQRFARFRAREDDYPASVAFSRTGDSLRLTFRGNSGLNTIREVVQDLELVR